MNNHHPIGRVSHKFTRSGPVCCGSVGGIYEIIVGSFGPDGLVGSSDWGVVHDDLVDGSDDVVLGDLASYLVVSTTEMLVCW